MTNTMTNLAGKLLLAMPGMSDARFETSAIYIATHSDEGAMGLIVNKPAPTLRFNDMMKQLDINVGSETRNVQVYFGGPVENGRGFVLHSTDYMAPDSTVEVSGDFAMTATLDILEDIAKGQGPSQSLLALGYAGWSAGQLEGEILQNGWLTCDATSDLVFQTPDAGKWTAAMESLGVNPLMLSADAGRA